MNVGRTANTSETAKKASAKSSFLCEFQPSTLHEEWCATKASISGRSKNTPFGKYTSIINPEIKPSTIHCPIVRVPLVRSQCQRNKATVNAECACDHAGLKYMYTGREVAIQIPMVARKAQRSRAYFLARKKENSNPKKP